ncbi:MAG: outer membrane beta-barrel protein [Ferruginibacter sp.]|nr:outer membrane beta-barrel protein [Chitinophagaceae bacterium]MBP6287053.1 outer membrane beta-barrel protein [Ferruginibacter sp.]
MKYFTLLISLFFLSIAANAQKGGFALKGQLTDSLQKQQVGDATVSLVNAKDSSLVGFTRTDSAGRFRFDHLKPGKYRLSASQVNFHPQWKNFEVNGDVDLGPVVMKDRSIMEEVTVKAQRPPVVVNGDTLEFNAEAFKTKPNAVVEDMLKKMPGVEVDKDGSIRVNGKRISRVLVNGRDFFNGDPKMATRNLSADAIDKVQVFDKQSDQSEFTGIDDGNKTPTLNLKLKKDKKNAAFGKATVAAGTKDRYDGQFNINKFNGDQQLSAIGMANNTNRQGFSIMDMLNFSGQSRRMMSGGGGRIVINNGNDDEFGLPVAGINNNQGITQTIAGGLNYNDTWKKKTEVNASYFYNNLTLDNTRNTSRQNILPGNEFNYLQNSSTENKTNSNRFNFSVDHKIDSFNSIKLSSVFGYQKGSNAKKNDYESFVPNDKMLNNGFSNTSNTTEGYVTNQELLYRHKFKKKGRTFSATGSMQYNDSRAKGTQNAINNFFSNGTISQRDTLDQVTRLNSITQSYGVNASYTEPLGKRSLLEFRGFYNTSTGDLDRKTYDYNRTSGTHDKMNTILSNAFENTYDYMGGGISMRTQQKKYGYSVGANLQHAQLNSHLKDSAFRIKQNFTNLLPVANFNYNFTKTKSLRLDYSTSASQPTAKQLQPVQDISDPLNIISGNPSLKQSYAHNASLQFFNASPARQKNLFVFLNYTATQNAIVNSDRINASGARTSMPVNTNGVYNINANIDRGFRIKKLNTRLELGLNANYNRSVNFINDDKNKTSVLSVMPRVNASYSYKELLDISAGARVSYNNARYSLQPSLNNNYWRQVYELEATVNLPAGFTISNEFSYSAYTGRSNGYNTRVALWNASVSKQVLKSKKGEIRLSAFDLLNQNTGVDRNGNANYVEDVQYKTLQRFFTLGFTYSLQKAGNGGPRAVIRTF